MGTIAYVFCWEIREKINIFWWERKASVTVSCFQYQYNPSSLVKQRICVFTQFKILKNSIKINLQCNQTQRKLPISKMDIFRCVPDFIKTADWQFPPKFMAKYIWFSDSEITGKLAGNQSWYFQNGIFMSQRKKNYLLSPRPMKYQTI